jgi:hypothetical protein
MFAFIFLSVTNFFLILFCLHVVCNFDYIPPEIPPEIPTELEKDDEPTNTTTSFEDKYKSVYKRMKQENKFYSQPQESENLKNSYVMEYYANYGNIIMKYDMTNKSFHYFADKTVPYRYLEPVARKYVIYNNCLSLYCDMDIELNRLESEKLEYKEDQEDNVVVKKTVFAKLKHSLEKPKDKKIFIKTNTNIYVYRGKLNNFQMIPSNVLHTKKLTFADFKQMNKST